MKYFVVFLFYYVHTVHAQIQEASQKVRFIYKPTKQVLLMQISNINKVEEHYQF
jgi:hypothetical protein